MKQVFFSSLKRLTVTTVMTLSVAALTVAPVAACKPASNPHTNHVQQSAQAHSKGKSALHAFKASTKQSTKSVSKHVPGDNGTVKIHQVTTSAQDRRNEPKVCAFNMASFGFDANQQIHWYIVEHTHGKTVLSGSTALSSGSGKTADYNLPNGMYKLYWQFDGEHGSAKHKVFKVECPVKPAGHVLPAHTEKPQQPTSAVVVAQPVGHVLAASTNVPGKGAATELANTGTNVLVATMLALFLAASAGAVYVSGRRTSVRTQQ